MPITAHLHLVPVPDTTGPFTGPCPPWCISSHSGDTAGNWYHHAAVEAIDVHVSRTPLEVTMGDSSDYPGPMVLIGAPAPGRGLPCLTLAEAEALGSMLLDIARRGFNGDADSHEATFAELEGPDYAAILDGALQGM